MTDAPTQTSILPSAGITKDTEMKDTGAFKLPTTDSVMRPPPPPTPTRLRHGRSDHTLSDHSDSSLQPGSATETAEDNINISRRGVFRRGSGEGNTSSNTAAHPPSAIAVRAVTFMFGDKMLFRRELSQPKPILSSRAGPHGIGVNYVLPLETPPPLRSLGQLGSMGATALFPSLSIPTYTKSFLSSPTPMTIPSEALSQDSSPIKPRSKRDSSPPTKPPRSTSSSRSTTSRRRTKASATPALPPPGFSIPDTLAFQVGLSWQAGPLSADSVLTYALPGPYIEGVAAGSKTIGRDLSVPYGVFRPVRLQKVGNFDESEVLAGFRFVVG
jgi:hypothetical protein